MQRIRSIIDESMSKPKGKGRGKSRLFGQMEPTQTSNQQPCLGTPFVSQQPLPLMSIQSSAPNSAQPIGVRMTIIHLHPCDYNHVLTIVLEIELHHSILTM